MRKILFIIALLPLAGFGQDGKTIKAIVIPRVEMPKPDKEPETTVTAPKYSIKDPFEPEKFKFPSKVYDEPKQESQGIANQSKSDLNVGKAYADKMNKSLRGAKEGSADSKAFRKHQYFGDFETESETIALEYRDFGEVDADRVRVWVDGKLIVELVELSGFEKKLFIGLEEGINHIEIEAVNEGALSPNTGEFGFYDENGKIITKDQWGLATGFKAKFNIVRVPKGTLNKKIK